jgi:hypothetical protein
VQGFGDESGAAMEGIMADVHVLAIDLAKRSFQVCVGPLAAERVCRIENVRRAVEFSANPSYF